MVQTNVVPRLLQSWDYVLLLSYFAIVIFIGNYFKKYVRQANDYFAAGSDVPWWLASISVWLSSFSATFFVIYSQMAFKYGIVALGDVMQFQEKHDRCAFGQLGRPAFLGEG